jgi:hypothetical protein
LANGQMSLAEALLHPRLGANHRPEAIDKAIDWAPLGALAVRFRNNLAATSGLAECVEYLPFILMMFAIYVMAGAICCAPPRMDARRSIG